MSHMQVISGFDAKKQEPESNVLLASIENMQYPVTVDVLHMVLKVIRLVENTSEVKGCCTSISITFILLLQVFSTFGPIQKIAMFEKNGGFQALIQFPGKAPKFVNLLSRTLCHQLCIFSISTN